MGLLALWEGGRYQLPMQGRDLPLRAYIHPVRLCSNSVPQPAGLSLRLWLESNQLLTACEEHCKHKSFQNHPLSSPARMTVTTTVLVFWCIKKLCSIYAVLQGGINHKIHINDIDKR